LYCLILCFMFGNIMRVFFLLGFVCRCLGFHCPFVFLLGANNGAVFRVVRYIPVWTDQAGQGYRLHTVCYIVIVWYVSV
jgi:hypothetical protein